jgi:hypothetical protein
MEETTSMDTTSLYKNAARNGAILGGIGIALTTVFYVVDPSLLVDWKVGILFILIFIGWVIYAGITYRKEVGGYLSYGKAFQHGYVLLITGGILTTIFSIVLYNVIDPSLPQTLADISVEKTGEMLAGFGTPQDKIDEQLETMRVEMPARFGVVGLLKQFGWGILINAVISVITALFVRKNQPELM